MRAAHWLALVVTATALAGCDRNSEPPRQSSAIFFPTWDTSKGVPGALLGEATLIREDGCLFARGTPGTRELLLVWPDGFRFDEVNGGRVLDATGDVVATVGGPLRLGGGIPETA
jgi:hypothetical protein